MNFGQVLHPGDRGDAVATLQKALNEYGYGIEANGEYDHTTREVVTAFQRHFRPERIDGIADPSTRGTLQELLATRGRPQNHSGARPHRHARRRALTCLAAGP